MESIIYIIQNFIKSLEQARANPNGVSGITTGFKELDVLSAGWQQTELIVIAAPPQMGKTAFALSALNNTMLDGKLGVHWFSTNLSKLQLTKMLLCNNLNIDLHTLLGANSDISLINEIAENLKFTGVVFNDSPFLTIHDIYMILSEEFEAYGKITEDIVIIDNLNQLNYPQNSRLELTDKFYQLKTLARKYEIPIICLLDTDISGSHFVDYETSVRVLEQNKVRDSCIDMLIQIFRPEYYRINEYKDGISCLGFADIIVSGRAVMNKTLRLKFNRETFKFNETNIDLNKCE